MNWWTYRKWLDYRKGVEPESGGGKWCHVLSSAWTFFLYIVLSRLPYILEINFMWNNLIFFQLLLSYESGISVLWDLKTKKLSHSYRMENVCMTLSFILLTCCYIFLREMLCCWSVIFSRQEGRQSLSQSNYRMGGKSEYYSRIGHMKKYEDNQLALWAFLWQGTTTVNSNSIHYWGNQKETALFQSTLI